MVRHQAFFKLSIMRSSSCIALVSALACALAQAPSAAGPDPSAAPRSPWAPYVEFDAWRASDAMPIGDFDGDWSKAYSPRGGRNAVFQRARAEIGVEKDGWRVGYEIRQQAALVTDRETLDLIRLYKQRQKPVAPSRFNVQAGYTNFSAQGLRVGRSFDGPSMAGRTPRFNISAAYYGRALRYRSNEVRGGIDYRLADRYDVNATQIDADSSGRFLFMRQSPEASGASVSGAVDFPLSDALALNIKIDDLWSRIHWRNLPVTQQTINTNVTEYDSQGYINYRPLLSGSNRQVGQSVELRRYGSSTLSYHAGNWRYAAQIARFAGVTIPAVSVGRQVGPGVVTASIETRFKTVGLGFEYGAFRLLVQSDSLRQDKAKSQAVQMSYQYAF
jgi:hypothetical protein